MQPVIGINDNFINPLQPAAFPPLPDLKDLLLRRIQKVFRLILRISGILNDPLGSPDQAAQIMLFLNDAGIGLYIGNGGNHFYQTRQIHFCVLLRGKNLVGDHPVQHRDKIDRLPGAKKAQHH